MSQAPTSPPSGDFPAERNPTISRIANPTTSMARMPQNIFVIGSVFMPIRAQGKERIDHSAGDSQYFFKQARQCLEPELASNSNVIPDNPGSQSGVARPGIRDFVGTGRDLSLLDALNSASDFHSHLLWGSRFRLAALGNLSHSIKAFSTGTPLALSHSLISGPAAWPYTRWE